MESNFSTLASAVDNDAMELIALALRQSDELRALAASVRQRNARRNNVSLRRAA